MNTTKPPYKFNNPYWTNDKLGKQGIRYRAGFLNFGSVGRKGGFEEVCSSEKTYYKNCTRDLSRKDLNTLRRELREGFMIMALQTMPSMEDSGNILGMLTGGKTKNDKTYE